jgi:tripeptidyl-peptidase I
VCVCVCVCAQLGVRGITIIYASGDSGAECENRCTVLDPSYPAISVYVTSIGSTKFMTGNTGPEAATSAFKSGGGFSNFSVTPSYQSAAVSKYLGLNIQYPPKDAFNSSGRGTPDFGALGDVHFQIIVGGRTFSIGGTSAAAPTFAAIVSILNDYRLSSGKPTLGFVNPMFYNLAATSNGAFFDVTSGDNEQGCGKSCAPNLDGFLCAPAWDPVSGFGTPNAQVLLTLV